MSLLETLLAIEFEILKDPELKDLFLSTENFDDFFETLPSLELVAREHALNLKKEREREAFKSALRNNNNNKQAIDELAISLGETMKTLSMHSKFSSYNYNPITQRLLTTLEKIRPNNALTGTKIDKHPMILTKRNTKLIFGLLRNIRTNTNLRFKSNQSNAQRVDRLAKRINCVRNARPEVKHLKNELNHFIITHHTPGSIIRKLRNRL